MSQAVAFDMQNAESRNRGTVAIRLILVIPHQIVMTLWAYWIMILAIGQWFIILFTGKRNESIWKQSNDWLGYATRVMTYAGLMHDVFPPFGTDPGNVPVMYSFAYDEPAERLSNALRFLWAIPASIVSMLYTIAAEVLAVIAWFAILFTGTMPQGIFDFSLKAHRQAIRTQSYTLLMTDVYPNANP